MSLCVANEQGITEVGDEVNEFQNTESNLVYGVVLCVGALLVFLVEGIVGGYFLCDKGACSKGCQGEY